jgi:polyisoprenoid-binding protein YceI
MARSLFSFFALGALAAAGPVLAQAPAAPPASASPPAAETPASATSGPRKFVIDGKKSQLVIQVFKAGAAAALAHDHTVHAADVAGEITADPASLESAKVNVSVKTKTLVNDDPLVRKQFGLDPSIPEKDRIAIGEAMRAEDQLNVSKYPTISFASTSVEKGSDGKLVLTGDFTLRGVTKKLKIPVSVKLDGASTLTGDGSVRFNASEWGMKPYSAFLGAVKNKDELVLNVHLVSNTSSAQK